MARSDPQLNFRCPADLKERIEQAASDSGRSITAEIVQRLEASFRSPLSILKREITVHADGPGFQQVFRIISPDKKPTREEVIAMAADEMRAVTAELDYLLSLIEEPSSD